MNWTNVTVKLGDLQPWEHNPRKLTKRQAERLIASWEKFGQFQTIAIGPNNEIYDGHQRLHVLHRVHGDNYTVDARRCDRALSEDERAVITLAANVLYGSWDWDQLAQWDAEAIKDWGMDAETLATWNNDAANLATMLGVDIQPDQPAGEDVIDEQYSILIECESEVAQADLLDRFNAEGLKCRALIS
jgi:ParB-like chromosome segregation protein Spo0J